MRLALLILFSLVLLCLHGQEPNYVRYSVEHGLPSSEIYQVYQSSDNHIWIATDNGISRYDGVEFVYYPVHDSLINRGFVIIHEDDMGALRFISITSNIYTYNKEADRLDLFSISPQDRAKINEKEPCSFVVDEQGHFLIGFTNQEGNARIAPNGMVRFDEEFQSASTIVRLHGDELSYCTTGNSNKKIEFNGTRYNLKNKFSPHVNAIRMDSIYTAVNQGNIVCVFKRNELISVSELPHIVIGLSTDNSGMLWVAKLHDGVSGFILEGDALVEKFHFLKNNSVTSVEEDHEGGHWFSTLKQGLYYAPNVKTAFYDQSRGTSGGSPVAITGNNLDEVVATYTNGSYTTFRADSIYATSYLRYDGHKRIIQSIYDVSFDIHSGCYVLSSGLVFKKCNGELYIPEIPTSRSRTSIASNDGTIWSGGGDLVSISPNGVSRQYSTTCKISALSFDLDSNIIAISRGGLFRLEDEDLIAIDNPLGHSAALRLIALLNDTLLAYINVREDIALVSPNDTLYIWHADEHDSKLLFDSEWQEEGYLWLNSNVGSERINIFNPEKPRLRLSRGLGVLHQSHVCSFTQNQHLWLNTNGGVYRLELEDLVAESPTTPWILAAETSNSEYLISKGELNLPAQSTDIRIKLNTISFKYADAYHFEYKLSPEHAQFRSFDGNELYFKSLDAGSHLLMVQTVTESGLRSEAVELVIHIPQVFWRSWWFLTLLVLLLFVITYLSFRTIVSRVKLKEEEKSKTKELINSLKLRSLQSQFNPHFTFNAINSIQNHISKENLDEAKEYLRMFSAIMRSILVNSGKECIKLAVELEMLETYLKLEQLRFGDKLNYVIELDDNVDPGFDEIPPLILQPIVENAINYGVFNKTGPGLIQVHISSHDDVLICTVTDNGIGREESMRIQRLKNSKSSGKGLVLVKERLDLLNKRSSESLEIIDLKTNEGQACGTRVTIKVEQGD